MEGPAILTQTMSLATPRGRSGEAWQYHSRSDHHSKVACWGVLFDMLRTSALLRRHAEAGKVVFGVNFQMRDFATGRKKDLDFVIARPSGSSSRRPRTLSELAERWRIQLTSGQRAMLDTMPAIVEGGVLGSGVLVALEAKAAMTAHSKAGSRLYDELNSSHLTIHGASNQALAVGLVMVNASPSFISPPSQGPMGAPAVIAAHNQPRAAASVVRKVMEIPRRLGTTGHGFDGLGVVVIDAANDGTPIRLVRDIPAPQPGDLFNYDDMLTRVSNEYDGRFAQI